MTTEITGTYFCPKWRLHSTPLHKQPHRYRPLNLCCTLLVEDLIRCWFRTRTTKMTQILTIRRIPNETKVKRNIKKWEKVYQAVRHRIKNAQKVRAQNQAKMALLFHPYQPGDRVRKKNHSTIQGSSKLSKPVKPDIYVVRRKLGDVNYEILGRKQHDARDCPP